MSNIVQGVKSAVQQPASYGFTPGRGYHQRLRWKISNPADIPALLGQLIAAGYAYEVSPEADGAITVVEATSQPASDTNGDPATQPLAEKWERDSMTTEKDILQSDLAIVAAIIPTVAETIRKAVADNAPPASALNANETKVYNLMLSGAKSIRVSSPVVRRTRITASSYTVKASDTNMGKILSTAQMTSLENAPTTVLFNLPSTGSSVGAAGVARRSGWYKKPAKVNQQGDGQWQITQEYEYDIWSSDLYESAS